MSPFGTTVGRTDGRTDRRSDVVIYRATISAKHLDPVFFRTIGNTGPGLPKNVGLLGFYGTGPPMVPMLR